jgi:TRAP-type transport system periplasmic protein
MSTKLAFALVLALAVASVAVPGTTPAASAQGTTFLRIATLAPRGTPLVKAFQMWDRLLRKETGGKVGVRIYPGGASGDEKVLVRKMRAGQLDGAAVTVTGLGLISRPALVLAAPGVIIDYAEIDLVRKEMAAEFDKMFEDAGYLLLGWGDAGRTRLFSQKRIVKPEDLRSARPWVWTDNPVMVEFIRNVGANGVRLGVPEVYPGLQTGMIDTVTASALTAVALQWFTRLKYMSGETSGVIIGALVLRKDRFDALPEDVQKFIRKTAQVGDAELRKAREMDDKAYKALIGRGMEAVDVGPHRKAWEQAFRKTTMGLAGRLYSKELLERVMTIVARVRRDYPVR